MGTTCTGAYRGRDEKRPNVWELHVQDNHRGRDEKRPNVWELHVQGPTEGGMRNVLMCGNYMYRGPQREG